MNDSDDRSLNPWLSIWTRPRETIQQIVDRDPQEMVLLLAAVTGFSEVLNQASMRGLGDTLEWPMILVVAAIAGPLGGIVGLYLGGFLIRWAGSWIGGVGSPQHIRAALAWSGVPKIWALALWIPEAALFGPELFSSETPRIEADPSLAYALIGFGLVEMVIGIWALVIFLKCLGQVQGFSAWKALGNSLLSVLVVAVPVAIVAVAIAMATSSL